VSKTKKTITTKKFKRIIDGFAQSKIAVVGDIVADIYIYCKPFKLSREAPVLVVRHDSEKIVPGGAGNAINNLAQLGASVYPISIIGNDEAGRAVLNHFADDNINLEGLIISDERETISKTRIMAGDDHTSKQQVIRIDKEAKHHITPHLEEDLLSSLINIAKGIDAILVSDYGHGVITPKLIEKISQIASKKIVVVDSRYHLLEYKDVTIITPNESEAEQSSGMLIKNDEDAATIAKKFIKELRLKAVLITRGNKGMLIAEKSGAINHIPIWGGDDIVDITGAGDTVTSVVTLSLISGANFYEAARLSNYAAGIVVMKSGTATLSRKELREAVEHTT